MITGRKNIGRLLVQFHWLPNWMLIKKKKEDKAYVFGEQLWYSLLYKWLKSGKNITDNIYSTWL